MTAYRSFYYEGAPEPDDLDLAPAETALLVIDVQNKYLERPARESVPPAERAGWDRWTPFHTRS
jgi:biuret amidohydrolase